MRTLPFMAMSALGSAMLGFIITLPYNGSGMLTQAIAKETIAQSRNVAKHLEPENIQASEDVLYSLFEAQISLYNKDITPAREHLEAALRELDKVADSELTTGEQDSIFEKPHYLGRKAVYIKFGSALAPEQAMLPLEQHEDGKIDAGMIHNALTIDGIANGKVSEAEIRYVSLDLDKENTRRQIEDALDALSEKSFDTAHNDIERILNNLMEHERIKVSPRIIAHDHIALTRYMVQQKEYDAARHALEKAESAVSSLEQQIPDMASLTSIHQQIDSLEQKIAKRDPNLAEKIDAQLEKWLDALS